MARSKHTPTPWRQFDDCGNATEIMGADGPTVAVTNAELGVRDINEAKANAALIVRAVNNHDALVEALGYVAEVIPAADYRDRDDSDQVQITVTVGWLREVAQALAAAQE